MQLEICYYKKKILANSKNKEKKYSDDYEIIDKAEKKAVDSLSIISILSRLYHKTLFGLWDKKITEDNFFEIKEEIEKETNGLREIIKTQFEFQNYFHSIKKNYYLLKKELNHKEIQELIDEFLALESIFQQEKYKFIKENDFERYFKHYHNFLNVCIRYRQLGKIPKYDFSSIAKHYKEKKDFTNFFTVANIMSSYDIYTGSWENAKNRIDSQNQDDLVNILKKYRDKIPNNHYAALTYNYLLINFVTCDFNMALTWCNLILDENFKEINVDHILLTKYIQVILMYNNKHINLDNSLRNIRDYANRHNKDEKIYSYLHSCLKQYFQKPNDKETFRKLPEWKNRLKTQIDLNHSLKPYILFVAWIDALENKTKLINAIQRYY